MVQKTKAAETPELSQEDIQKIKKSSLNVSGSMKAKLSPRLH